MKQKRKNNRTKEDHLPLRIYYVDLSRDLHAMIFKNTEPAKLANHETNNIK